MDDAASVGELQRIANLRRDLQDYFSLESLAGANAPRQAALLEIWHDEVGALLAVTEFEDLNDMGVLQPLEMPYLFQEAMDHLSVGQQFRPDHLDGDLVAGSRVPRQQHHSHAARA